MRSVSSENPLTGEARQAFDVHYITQSELREFAFSPEAAERARKQKCAPIVRKDVDRQIVYGVVYAPGEVDAHGEFMLPSAVEEMCHKFMSVMADKGMSVIDQQHDNVPVAAYPVESWIETEEGRPWPVGSWIMGVKVMDPVVWEKIKKGEINGYSFEAMVSKMPMVVEIEVEHDLLAKTAPAYGHDHVFFLEFDVTTGKVKSGLTSFDLGHRHVITAGTATEMAGGPGVKPHAHRLPV